MSKPEEAAAFMRAIAADNSHGYDQAGRWGPDYDCSALVITAYQQAGVPVRDAGATYTGNMLTAFLSCGFRDVTAAVSLGTGAGLAVGDVLLNVVHHAAMYIGGGRLAQASINERGGVTGGQTGDQTGGEIAERGYYNFPWDHVLRYGDAGGASPSPTTGEAPDYCETTARVLRRGDCGALVAAMQGLLIAKGYGCGPDGADGDFGPNTLAALIKLQTARGIDEDGACRSDSWAALLR